MDRRRQRLKNEYDILRMEFAGHPLVKVVPIDGLNPPEKYEVTYSLPGLMWNETTGKPRKIQHHVFQIFLPISFPNEGPTVVPISKVFHPNIGGWVCLGHIWAASRKIVDVIVQLGEMIQYKNYNVDSPMDLHAAEWARTHRSRLPISDIPILQPDFEIEIR